jgi:hypothetical protein
VSAQKQAGMAQKQAGGKADPKAAGSKASAKPTAGKPTASKPEAGKKGTTKAAGK